MARVIDRTQLRGGNKSLKFRGKTFPVGPQITSFKAPTGSGAIYLSTAGQTFEGYNCFGRDIVINADNVTVRNCLINATSWYPLNNIAGKKGFVAEFNLLDGEKKNVQNAAMFSSEAGDSIFRNNIVLDTPTDMVIMCGGLCEHNALAGAYYQDGAHADAFSIGKSLGAMIVRENYVDLTAQPDGKGNPNSCMKVVSHFGAIDNVLIDNNILLGGGYNMYCGSSPNPVNNVRVTNNLYGLSAYGAGKPDGFIVGGGKSPDNGSNFVNSNNQQFATAADDVIALGGSVPVTPPFTPVTPTTGNPKCTARPVIDGGTKIGERASTGSGSWEAVQADWKWAWEWAIDGKITDDKSFQMTPQVGGQLVVMVTVTTPQGGKTTVVSDPVTVAGAPAVIVPPVVPVTPEVTGRTLTAEEVAMIKTAVASILKTLG